MSTHDKRFSPLWSRRILPLASALVLAGACGGEGDSGDEIPDEGEIVLRSVAGSVVDFETGDPVTGGTVAVDGVSPAPSVTVTGSDFEVSNIPPYSNFHLLVGSPPNYRNTYSTLIETLNADQSGVVVETLSESYVADLYDTFGVTDAAGSTLVVVELVDDVGAPLSGVSGTAFDLPNSVVGPFFLAADLSPDANLSASSESGYAVFFDVEPGVVSFASTEEADLTVNMPDAPVAARTATLSRAEVIDGKVELPSNLSFDNDIIPLFEDRGCVLCHSGSGIGKDLGGLHLNGESQKAYKEVAEEVSANYGVPRVDLETPENSLLLTFPSKEDPPDAHPNSTFQSDTDPDYLKILVWIQEGALDN